MIAASNPEQPGLLLIDYMKTYLLERETSAKYRQMLRLTVEHFNRFFGRSATLGDLSDHAINTYLESLMETHARSTVRGERVRLLSLWRSAFQAELIETMPRRVKRIVVPQLPVDTWTPAEVKRLLNVAGKFSGRFRSSRILRREFWTAYILAAYDTGLRMGDLMAIRIDDIQSDGSLVVCQHKTGKPVRCRLRPETMAAIHATFPPAREFVFGKAITEKLVYLHFKAMTAAAGLKGTSRKLRKTSGTIVESLMPGAGHRHLGNGADVFRKHYLDEKQLPMDRPLPPSIVESFEPATMPPVERIELPEAAPMPHQIVTAAVAIPVPSTPAVQSPSLLQFPPAVLAALALPKLSADGFRVLTEYLYSFGMTKAAIADRLGFTPDSLRKNLSRGKPVTTRMDRALRTLFTELAKGGPA